LETRICTGCKRELVATLEFFNKARKGKYGLTANCKECNNKYKRDNKKSISESNKNYRKDNKESISESNKNYRKNNVESVAKRDKEKYFKNKKSIMEQSRIRMNNRRNTDPAFKLLGNLRNRLWYAIKGNTKSARTMELIGCTVEYLMLYLENQFTEGMTWENYGEWHIDHIVPCASFDFTKEEEQFKCFNYKNLQPLWAEDNFKKRDKMPTEMEGEVK